MLELSFDPDARTIYAYFDDINPGDDQTEVECPGAFVLDANGQIVGFDLEVVDRLLPAALQNVTRFSEVQLSADATILQLRFGDTPSTTRYDFPYPAIADLAAPGNVLGIEFIADPEFHVEERLRWLTPNITETFGSDEEAAQPDDEVVPIEPEPGPQAATSDLQPAPEEQASDGELRTGFVALVGKPNVGKSTLLNAYLGTKVSIVSPKPQTTRFNIRGILNRPEAQIVFVDTPGLHVPRSRLGEYMVATARRSIPDADVVCFVVDASEPPDNADRAIADSLKRVRKPKLLVLNKIDVARHVDSLLGAFRALGPWDMEVAVSAKNADGIDGLLGEIMLRLPVGPRLFPADQYTDLTEREQVAEFIREKVLLNTAQEVPHGIAVEVEEWEERGDRLYIRATVNVEREGHKGIIIGEHGQMLKKIGAAARYEIERLLGRQIFLDLWVKVRKDWRSDPAALRWLGYDVNKLRDS